MPTIGNHVLTYRDLVSRLKGDKTFDHDIVEILLEQTPMLDDMVIAEANDGTSNRTTIRTGIPGVTWVAFYEGVQGSTGSVKSIRNTAGRLMTKIEVDAALWDQAPDKNALLLDEVNEHANAMTQEMQEALIYGMIKNEPRKFNGLINFYNEVGGVKSTNDKVSSHYVFSAKSSTQASTSQLRSIWLVGWAQKSIRAFYPQGTKGGLKKGTWDKETAFDGTASDNRTYQVYRQYMEWQLGLDVRDYRYAGRLANLQADHMFDTSGVPEYIELLRRLVTRVKSQGAKQAWYMDQMTWEAVGVWLSRKTMENAIQHKDLQERQTNLLFGVPVRICDALNTNEGEVPTIP